MSNQNTSVKLIFGFIIFLFSLALAFFTANYFRDNNIFNYWGTLMVFSALYIAIGILVCSIYSISLGFLLSGDVVLLYILNDNFGDLNKFLKIIVILIIIILLYFITWMVERKRELPPTNIANNIPNL